jgi:hypothetical protein
MKKIGKVIRLQAAVLVFTLVCPCLVSAQAIIVDHTCVNLSLIPQAWIDEVQANTRFHYAHTSHGEQLTVGLEQIMAADARYAYALEYNALPNVPGSLCIFDGQEYDSYVTPDLYWETDYGMNFTRDVLWHNPTINRSGWGWCTQLDYYSEEQVQAYLDSMAVLEARFPNVRFVYFTGNAQATGYDGYQRSLRNSQIREWCQNHGEVLFDFEDLDAWYYNTSTSTWYHETYTYSGNQVPVEHAMFHGDEAAHTTYASCIQKGKALWWLLARMAGWNPGTDVEGKSPAPASFGLSPNFPNPFNPETRIEYAIPCQSRVSLRIFNVQGEVVRSLVDDTREAGSFETVWNGKDDQGRLVESGVYFCKLQAGSRMETGKMTLIR